MAKTAFLTGATGFLGKNILLKLLAENWNVVTFVRSEAGLMEMKRLDVEARLGDLTDGASIARIMPNNCDAVFHVAGDTSLWSGNNTRQSRVNIEGTRVMAEASLAKNVSRFVYTSSAWALGEVEGLLDENTPSLALDSSINYCRSKWLAEGEVSRLSAEGLASVILRPTVVLGEHDRSSWARVIKWALAGKFPPVPTGSSSFTDVADVASAHVVAATASNVAPLYVLGGVNHTYLDFAKMICDVLDIRTNPETINDQFFQIIGLLGSFCSLVLGKEVAITKEAVRATLLKQEWDSSRAVADLSYQIAPIEKTITKAIDWVKGNDF